MLPAPYTNWREQNFTYGTGWSAAMAAVGAGANLQVTLADDAPFICYYLQGVVRQGAAGAEVILLNWAGEVMITESASGKTLMNVAIPFDLLMGNGRDQFPLPPPRIYAKSSTIQIAVTSNVVARTQVAVALVGSKLFPPNGMMV